MPYLLLILGLLIGLYALYRFFMNASVGQIKAFFLMAMLVVLAAALLVLALSGRLPAAIAILAAIAPLAAGWWRAGRRNQDQFHFNDEFDDEDDIVTRERALKVLGLKDTASEADIKAAYKRLMHKIHPDHEGSEWMAAKLNQARDLLLKK